ncbi:uncharacterized protein LOC109541730 [Dendroctonus ponderosae]
MLQKTVLISLCLVTENVQFGRAIQCFQCLLADRPFYEDAQAPAEKTCRDFDRSPAYVVDCPESTFCYKKTVEDRFYNSPYVREERGCAPQMYRGLKQTASLQWVTESRLIQGAYERGCRRVEDFGLRSLHETECFCDEGDLCNSAAKLQNCWLWLLFIVSGAWVIKIQ